MSGQKDNKSDVGWKGKTRGGLFGYRFFIALINLAGVKAAYAFLCLVVIYFIPFAPAATRSVCQLAHRLGYGFLKSTLLLFRNYYSLGRILIDNVALGEGKKDAYHFHFGENYPDFLKLLDSGKGVVLISAHVGNWEIGAPFFSDYGKKMNIVIFDAEYQKIKKLLEAHRKEQDYKFIPVNNDSLAHVFLIKDALDRLEYVCFQGDRHVAGSQVLHTEFLGKEAAFPAGPFLLAAKMQAPVVFYFALREKGMSYSFNFVIAQPVVKGNGVRPEQQLLEQYRSLLEKIARKHPEQWFNYFDFWKAI